MRTFEGLRIIDNDTEQLKHKFQLRICMSRMYMSDMLSLGGKCINLLNDFYKS